MKRFGKRAKRRIAKGLNARLLRNVAFKRRNKKSKSLKPAPQNSDDQTNVRRKQRLLGSLFRASIVLLILFISALAVTFVALNLFVTKEWVTSFIHDQAKEKLGAKIEFSWEKYSFLTGFSLKDVRVFLPNSKEERTVQNNAHHKRPIFQLSKLNIDYDLESLLFMKLKISEVSGSQPEIYYYQNRKHTSFSGVLEHRNEHKVPIEIEVDTEESDDTPKWLLLLVSNLYSPITVEADDIGFINLKVSIDDKKDEYNQYYLSGLSTNSSIRASGFENSVKIRLYAEQNGISFTKNKKPYLSSLTDIDFSITNLREIRSSIKSTTKFQTITPNPRLNLTGQIDAAFFDEYSGLNLKKAEFQIEDFLKLDAQAEVEWPKYSSDVLKIDFKNSFRLDATDNFTSSIKEISNLDLSGSVNESCVIQGKLSLDEPDRSFPIADCEMNITDFSVSYGKNYQIKDLNLESRLMIRSGSGDGEFIFEPEYDMTANTVLLQQNDHTIKLEDIESTATARTKIDPEFFAPRNFIDFSAYKTSLFKGDALIASESLRFDSHVKSSSADKMYRFSSRLQLGDIVKNALSINCKYPCKRLNLATNGNLDITDSLYNTLSDLYGKDHDKYLPTELSYIAKYDLNLNLTLPEHTPKDLRGVLVDTKPNLKGSFKGQIPKMVLKEPYQRNLDLSHEIEISATSREVILRFVGSVDSSETLIEGVTINNRNMKLVTNWKLDIPKSYELNDLSIAGDISPEIGTIIVSKDEQSQTYNFKDFRGSVFVDIHDMREIEIYSPRVSLGELLTHKFTLDIQRDRTGFLREIVYDQNTEVDLSLFSNYAPGIRSEGRTLSDLKITVKNEEDINLSGEQIFNNVTIISDKFYKDRSLELIGLNGRVPVTALKKVSEIRSFLEDEEKEEDEKKVDISEKIEKSLVSRRKQDVSASDSERILVGDDYFSEINKDPITLSKFSFGGFDVESVNVNLSLSSDALSIDSAEFATLGGLASGRMYVKLDPLPTRVSAYFHVADINMEELPYRIRNQTVPDSIGEADFSMNAFIDLNVGDQVLNGEVDITKIGRIQAEYFLDALDPNGENEHISYARTGLAFGYPAGIAIPINDGMMDVRMDVRTFGIPLPLPKITGISVFSFFDNLKEEYGL